jgi:hypothetical protein
MLGHGKIFEGYASGILKDDDEVAVVHGPAEANHIALTDAMVDIRHNVAVAQTENLFSSAEAENIIAHAKSCHFKNRLLADSVAAIFGPSQLPPEIARWLALRKVGLKEIDASDTLKNLARLVPKAQQMAMRAPKFIPTVYLRRMEPFGYTRNTAPQRMEGH